MIETKHSTREAWLAAAVKAMEPLFAKSGSNIPPIRVTCGWPSERGTSEKKRCIGQYWTGKASKDGVAQIFITPWLDEAEVAAPVGVLSTLAHEVVHAVAGIEAKHGPAFKKIAVAIGLEGKMTATIAGEELCKTLTTMSEALGPFPHSKIDPTMNPVKKQSTRMVKCVCKEVECGFLVRTSRKWITDVGSPHCPVHGEMEAIFPN